MIDNFDSIEEISKAMPMTETELQKRIAKAKEKENYISMAVFCAAKVLNSCDK